MEFTRFFVHLLVLLVVRKAAFRREFNSSSCFKQRGHVNGSLAESAVFANLKKPCIALIDQGGESFTGYGFEAHRIDGSKGISQLGKCKSKTIVKEHPELANSKFDDGANFLDYSGRVVVGDANYSEATVVKYLTALYEQCLLTLSSVCEKFTVVHVYQTGKMRAKALKDENTAVRQRWEKQMEDNMQAILGRLKSGPPKNRAQVRAPEKAQLQVHSSESFSKPVKFKFEFLENGKEAALEAENFFGETWSAVEFALEESVAKEAVIAFGIGSSSAQAFAYPRNGRDFEGFGHEYHGVKPMATSEPEVPYEEMKAALLGLMRSATHLQENDGSYKVVIAMNAIKYNFEFVRSVALRCLSPSNEAAQKVEGQCSLTPEEYGPEGEAILRLEKGIMRKYKKRGPIKLSLLSTFAQWVSRHYTPTAKEQQKDGKDPAKFLDALCRAVLAFRVDRVIIDDGVIPAGSWANQIAGILVPLRNRTMNVLLGGLAKKCGVWNFFWAVILVLFHLL